MQIAEDLYHRLSQKSHILGLVLNLDGDFPTVEYWDESMQNSVIVACYEDDEAGARAYAWERARIESEEMSADIGGPVQVLAAVVTWDGAVVFVE